MNLPKDIQRERLYYIEFLALFSGQVGRKDLTSRFGISEPAATKDLSLYGEFAPSVLRYDLRRKCYVFDGGRHILSMTSSRRYTHSLGTVPLTMTHQGRSVFLAG